MTDFYYQLYSSRNYDLDETLSLLSSLGYKGVEAYEGLFIHLDDPSEFKEKLGAHGLVMKTCHMGVDLIQKDISATIDLANKLGVERVYAPYLNEDQRPKDASGWREFAQLLSKMGQPIMDAGLGFGWHNHDFEFTKLADGQLPMDILLQEAAAIEVEFDVAWAVRAGYDPMEFFKTYGSRITAAHVKDIAPEGEKLDEDGWADVGHGIVDWPTFYQELKTRNVPYLVMEHDNPSDHVRFATNSIKTMNAL